MRIEYGCIVDQGKKRGVLPCPFDQPGCLGRIRQVGLQDKGFPAGRLDFRLQAFGVFAGLAEMQCYVPAGMGDR